MFLAGERVYLRPTEAEDLEAIQRWFNDPGLRGLTGSTLPWIRADARDWLDRVRQDAGRVWFSVVLHDDHRLVGEAGLLRVNHPWRTADLSIILGEPGARGKGYGTEVARLLMDWAFGALNLHRLAVGVVGFNTAALHFWEKMGFRREGVQRDGYFWNHSFHDFVMMSILAHEFKQGGAFPG